MGLVSRKDEMAMSKRVFTTFLSKTRLLVKIPLKSSFFLLKFSLTKFFEKCVKSVLTVLTQNGVNVFIH